MRFIYTVLLYLSLPFIFLRLWLRSRHDPAHRQRWKERLGSFICPPHYQHGIWIHAVSLGESIAAVPLIKGLHQRHPEVPIIMTSMTVSGSTYIQKTLRDEVFHVYAPYDIPFAIQGFLNRTRVRGLVLLETELWPNTLLLCQKASIPVVLSNARLSERSYRRYRMILSFMKKSLSGLTAVAAHAHPDAERLIQLGIPKASIQVTGSLKFDHLTQTEQLGQTETFKKKWGSRPVWMAASTHEGEEKIILNAFKEILAVIPQALLILAPRHPERFTKVIELSNRWKFEVVTRTSEKPCKNSTQIYLLNTIGEVKAFYGAADIAFVGGSLIPSGGHNMLEPLSLGIPTIVGPHTFNFTPIVQLLLEEKALIQMQPTTSLAKIVIQLWNDREQYETLQANAKKVIEKNKGAVEKNLRLLEEKILKN